MGIQGSCLGRWGQEPRTCLSKDRDVLPARLFPLGTFSPSWNFPVTLCTNCRPISTELTEQTLLSAVPDSQQGRGMLPLPRLKTFCQHILCFLLAGAAMWVQTQPPWPRAEAEWGRGQAVLLSLSCQPLFLLSHMYGLKVSASSLPYLFFSCHPRHPLLLTFNTFPAVHGGYKQHER